MAYIKGTSGNDFDLTGTNASDVIDGFEGDDYIWGFGGVDYIAGGEGVDHVFAGDGDDVVDGEGGGDWLFGDGGNDIIWGGVGVDHLFGGYGDDSLYGGYSSGGWGMDYLTGGPGRDTFFFESYDSDPWSDPDHITDFQATAARSWGPYDKIDMGGPAGTTSNYFETMIAYNGGFDLARNFANYYISEGATYVFITDSVNGYFFSNVTGYSDHANNGVVLEGLTTLSDFSHQNIVDLY
jgi:Ca2+-binding RTX toxin-like protein